MHPSRPPSPADAHLALQPVQPRERIVELDILRGFALFGILLVNMMYFAHPVYREVLGLFHWAALHDRVAAGLVLFFAQGKFFTLFSLLFGLGLAIQMRRAQERGRSIVPLFLRRMLILFLFGAAHIALLWFGDILLYYAILGMALLLFRNAKPRTLVKWAVAFLILPLVFFSGIYGLMEMARSVPEGAAEIDASFAEMRAEAMANNDKALQVYSDGSFGEMVQQRIADYGFTTVGMLFTGMGFIILTMFLLGLYVGKRGIIDDLRSHRSLFRRMAIWGGLVGVAANLVYVGLGTAVDPLDISPAWLLMMLAFLVGAPALCLAYASGLIVLLQRDSWRGRLDFLSPVGRMALSNYILQSVICTTLVYGYGLGLYGQIGPAAGIALTIAIFALQVGLSGWWMSRYRFGPLEWLWRTLTYGRLQPIRSEAVAA